MRRHGTRPFSWTHTSTTEPATRLSAQGASRWRNRTGISPVSPGICRYSFCIAEGLFEAVGRSGRRSFLRQFPDEARIPAFYTARVFLSRQIEFGRARQVTRKNGYSARPTSSLGALRSFRGKAIFSKTGDTGRKTGGAVWWRRGRCWRWGRAPLGLPPRQSCAASRPMPEMYAV